jgi:hypothetical protein
MVKNAFFKGCRGGSSVQFVSLLAGFVSIGNLAFSLLCLRMNKQGSGCELAFRHAVRSLMRNGTANSEKLMEIIQQEKQALEALIPSRLFCKYTVDCVEKFAELAHVERLGIVEALSASASVTDDVGIVWETGMVKQDEWFHDPNGHTSTVTTFNLDSFMALQSKGWSDLFVKLGVYYFKVYKPLDEGVSLDSDLFKWMPFRADGAMGWKFMSPSWRGMMRLSEQLELGHLLKHVPRIANLELTKFQALWLVRLLGLAAFCRSVVGQEATFVTSGKAY